MGSLFTELRRRNVFRVGLAYAIVGWFLVQLSDALFPALLLPDWSTRLVVGLLIIGFPVALLLAWAFEITPEGIKREADVDRSASITQATGRKLDFVIIGTLVLALGYFVYDKFMAAETPEVAAESEKSIAVLPFIDLSPGKDQEYFSDGISEELLNVLAKTPGLRVAARTSSFSFKGKDTKIQDIGRELNVATVLEGSVRKAGTRLRITAQLIDVADGYHIWTETYDRELTDVFAIQDEISHAIVDALKVHLVGVETAPPTVIAAANLEAYNLYLRGRFFVQTRTKDALETARANFGQAIGLDPAYAPAYTGLADSIMLLRDDPGSYGDIPPDEAVALARPLIEKALALDPQLADAHASLGLLEWQENNFELAAEALRRAIALSPNLARAHMWLSSVQVALNQEQEAFAILERALVLDPLSIPGNYNMASMLVGRNRHDEALARYEKLVELNPGHPIGYRGVGQMHQNQARFVEAVQWYRKALDVEPGSPGARTQLGFLMLDFGDFDAALELIPEFSDVIWVVQGRVDEALAITREKLDAKPDDMDTVARAALVEAYAGRHARSRALLEQLAAKTTGTDGPLYHVNFVYPANILLAYLRAADGDSEGAMELIGPSRAMLERDRDAGIDTPNHDIAEAALLVVEGRRADAVKAFARAVERKFRSRFILSDPIFIELADEPGFEALVTQINDDLDAARARLMEEES